MTQAATETPAPSGAVLVTGASAGIGAAIVDAFRAEGLPVVAADDPAPHQWPDDPAVRAVKLDVANRDDHRAAAAAAVGSFGGLRTVVTHAFVGWPERFLEIDEQSWDQVLATNLKGAFLSVQEGLNHLQAGGSVVIVSSIAGRRSSSVMGAHYTCARYALIGLGRHLAVELAGTGVRVNVVCPGPPDAPSLIDYTTEEERAAIVARTPLRRLAQPAEVADAVAFLASDRARHIHGAVLDVNGGLY
jgi:NAD(P)-dependent dehydrogenase (short-subunit alcohol dehydrogenase family)